MKKFFILLRQELQLSDRILLSVLQNKNWFQEFDFDYFNFSSNFSFIHKKALYYKRKFMEVF